jgi:hypothetical protein
MNNFLAPGVLFVELNGGGCEDGMCAPMMNLSPANLRQLPRNYECAPPKASGVKQIANLPAREKFGPPVLYRNQL